MDGLECSQLFETGLKSDFRVLYPFPLFVMIIAKMNQWFKAHVIGHHDDEIGASFEVGSNTGCMLYKE